jgi:hypothetical protein
MSLYSASVPDPLHSDAARLQDLSEQPKVLDRVQGARPGIDRMNDIGGDASYLRRVSSRWLRPSSTRTSRFGRESRP